MFIASRFIFLRDVAVVVSSDSALHQVDQVVIALYSSFVEISDVLCADFSHVLLSKAISSEEIVHSSFNLSIG
jgi:hypothetical protein